MFQKRRNKNLRIIKEAAEEANKSLCGEISFEEKCEEATTWLKFILQIWEEEQSKGEGSFIAQSRSSLGQYRQCAINIKPLITLLEE